MTRTQKIALTAVAACFAALALIVTLGVIAGDADETAEEEQEELTPEEMASIREEAGYPPEPDAKTVDAYIAALDAIHPDIDKDKPDQAVSRGANQCRTIHDHPDDLDHQIEQALARFTVTTRLPELNNPEVGEQINNAVHEHLCPGF